MEYRWNKFRYKICSRSIQVFTSKQVKATFPFHSSRRIDLLYPGSKGRTSRRIESFQNQIHRGVQWLAFWPPWPDFRFVIWTSDHRTGPCHGPIRISFHGFQPPGKEREIRTRLPASDSMEPFLRNSNGLTIRKEIIFSRFVAVKSQPDWSNTL